jgi:hypothetical protein
VLNRFSVRVRSFRFNDADGLLVVASAVAPIAVRPARTSRKQNLVNRRHGPVKRVRETKTAALLDEARIRARLLDFADDCCCGSECLASVGVGDVQRARVPVHWGKSEAQVLEWVRGVLQVCMDENGGVNYIYRARCVCRSAWMVIYGICEFKLARARQLVLSGRSVVVHGNVERRPREQHEYVSAWLAEYLECTIIVEKLATGKWRINDFQVGSRASVRALSLCALSYDHCAFTSVCALHACGCRAGSRRSTSCKTIGDTTSATRTVRPRARPRPSSTACCARTSRSWRSRRRTASGAAASCAASSSSGARRASRTTRRVSSGRPSAARTTRLAVA